MSKNNHFCKNQNVCVKDLFLHYSLTSKEITGQPLQLLQAPKPPQPPSTTTFKKHKDQLLQLQQLQTPPHHPSCSKGNTTHFTAPPYATTTTTTSTSGPTTSTSPSSKSVSILVYKTLNTVVKSGRKIIVRVCEVANTKKTFKMFNAYKMKARTTSSSTSAPAVPSDPKQSTGHDRFCQIKLSSAAR